MLKERLEKRSFNSSEAQTWSNLICESMLKYLTDTSADFKFMVNCMILQKKSDAAAGLSMSGSCYWESDLDGNLVVKYETASIICILNVYGCTF